jgi:hypothetical protein
MKKLIYILSASILLISGCQKIFEKPSWNTDIKAPLIKTTLGVDDIIQDTSNFKVEGDSIKLVSREKIYDLNLDSLVKLEVLPFQKNVKLSTLKLDSKTVSDTITLGRLARQLEADGNFIGTYILTHQGGFFPAPAINNLTAGPLDVDVNQFFEYADLLTGTMEITLKNNLPLDITSTTFELKNKTLPGPPIATQTYTNLYKNTSQTKSDSLGGKTVEGDLVVNILDMDLSSGLIQIDTNDALIVIIKIKNVTVSGATAVFPAQDVVNEKSETSLMGLGELELTKAKISKGRVKAIAYSTAEDTVYFTYKIPSATLGTDTFVIETKIPPALPGQTVVADFSADFDGYDMDLRGKLGDTVNRFYSELTARIEYTGKKVNLTLQDSIYVIVELEDAIPSYVEGYLGDSVIAISGNFDLHAFDKIQSGTLNFEEVNCSIVVENGLGIPGQYSITSLTALNTRTGQSLNLSPVPLSGTITQAQKTPYGPVTTVISMNGTNIRDLLNILPDKITYSAQLSYGSVNTPAPDFSDDDFAYSGTGLNPYLDLELPLSIYANQLVLSDTTDFVSENFKTSVNSGTFTVHSENGFPLSGDLSLYFLDQSGIIIDSVETNGAILPAPVNAQNRVTGKMSSRSSFYVSESKLQNILRSRKVIFKVKFNTTAGTTPPNSYVKIYTDYDIDFRLTGDFNYTIE